MATLTYPTNAEIEQIAKDYLDELTYDDPVFSIMPTATKDAAVLLWEQEDNFYGLQQIRGLGGTPPKVQRVGGKTYLAQPGVYGEQLEINEREMVERRQWGTFGTPIDITDLVMPATRQMTVRQISRMRQILWTLLSTGTFSVSNANGSVSQTDTYSVQTFSSSVPWTTYATAKPLYDLRQIKLLHRGHSVAFDNKAKCFVSSVTLNAMLSNTNAADIYGRRTAGLGTYNTLAEANNLYMGENLPTIVEYDEGWYDDTNTWVPALADGVGVVVGRRTDGGVIGNYLMTRDATNADMGPGAYMKLVDNAAPGNPDPVPRRITMFAGHSGGPIMKFPSAVVKCVFFT